MVKYYGWLFGLMGKHVEPLVLPNLKIRHMNAEEKVDIIRRSTDFFAHDRKIWENMTNTFPYVYEKDWPDHSLPHGGEDAIAVLFSLLSNGEVKAPITWSVTPIGDGSSASSSTVIELFFRFINGKLAPVNLEDVITPFCLVTEKLGNFIFSQPHEAIDAVLLDRIASSKLHPLKSATTYLLDTNLVGRATDISMALEYLFNEGSTSEVNFRLGMSIAWLLGEDITERQYIINAMKATYGLRSKKVHGGVIKAKDVNKESVVQAVVDCDRFLRRAVIIRLIAGKSDSEWVELFTRARLGEIPESFERAKWISN